MKNMNNFFDAMAMGLIAWLTVTIVTAIIAAIVTDPTTMMVIVVVHAIVGLAIYTVVMLIYCIIGEVYFRIKNKKEP